MIEFVEKNSPATFFPQKIYFSPKNQFLAPKINFLPKKSVFDKKIAQ